MSVRKFAINEYITSTGEIEPNLQGHDISNLNQLRIVTEDAGGTNTIDIKVRIKGQSAFTTLTTVTGIVNTVIDIETYDQIKIECSTFDGTRVLVVAVGFSVQKSGAFEYVDFASFPPATGSGNFAWDAANQTMYFDEPGTNTWIQVTNNSIYQPEVVKTITAGDITVKQITLSSTPSDVEKTRLFIQGGPTQFYGDDFTVTGNVLSWNGLGLDGLISANDKIFITYN